MCPASHASSMINQWNESQALWSMSGRRRKKMKKRGLLLLFYALLQAILIGTEGGYLMFIFGSGSKPDMILII